jgi:antitoxin (DNA-binding transcriptional repressor) of toxin-antitoxin stability system
MQMKSVNIAKFKTELGTYLGFVRKGEEIIILDRKTPLARVIPFHEKHKHELIVSEALDDPLNLFKLKSRLLSKESHDSLRFLKDERDD